MKNLFITCMAPKCEVSNLKILLEDLILAPEKVTPAPVHSTCSLYLKVDSQCSCIHLSAYQGKRNLAIQKTIQGALRPRPWPESPGSERIGLPQRTASFQLLFSTIGNVIFSCTVIFMENYQISQRPCSCHCSRNI
jgi:hypothetical protein